MSKSVRLSEVPINLFILQLHLLQSVLHQNDNLPLNETTGTIKLLDLKFYQRLKHTHEQSDSDTNCYGKNKKI